MHANVDRKSLSKKSTHLWRPMRRGGSKVSRFRVPFPWQVRPSAWTPTLNVHSALGTLVAVSQGGTVSLPHRLESAINPSATGALSVSRDHRMHLGENVISGYETLLTGLNALNAEARIRPHARWENLRTGLRWRRRDSASTGRARGLFGGSRFSRGTDVGRSFLRTEVLTPWQEVVQVFCSPTCCFSLPPPRQVTTAVLVAIRNEAGLCDWLTVRPLYLRASLVFRPTCESTRHRVVRILSRGMAWISFFAQWRYSISVSSN